MTNGVDRFEVEIEFESVLRALSTEIYATPHAFLRENLQNAIDACRMQALRQKISPDDPSLRIDITVSDSSVQIQDRGIGMSPDDLRNLFWENWCERQTNRRGTRGRMCRSVRYRRVRQLWCLRDAHHHLAGRERTRPTHRTWQVGHRGCRRQTESCSTAIRPGFTTWHHR